MLAGRMIALLMNLAVQVLTVRYLSKTEFGSFAFAISMVALGANLSLLGLNRSLARFVPLYHEQRTCPHGRNIRADFWHRARPLAGVGPGRVLRTWTVNTPDPRQSFRWRLLLWLVAAGSRGRGWTSCFSRTLPPSPA
jgi:hypothetical protein